MRDAKASMVRRGTMTSLSVVIAAGVALAQENNIPDYTGSYLCKIHTSSGFRFDASAKVWVPTTFNTANEAYIFSMKRTGEVYKNRFTEAPLYSVTYTGFDNTDPPRPCYDFRTKSQNMLLAGMLICRSFGTEFRVNMNSQKIQVTFDGGYLSDEPSTDTPYIALGQCKKFN